jgi:oligopeptide/dipeptide ABC transporter ATP-binding protein
LQDLQRDFALTYLFISHDLSVIRRVSNKVGVMYLGRMMEFAAKDEIFAQPLHPYTQALLAAAPTLKPGARRALRLEGETASAANPPSGCVFHTRCPVCLPVCAEAVPPLKATGAGHKVACHLVC